jgi:hypothetical protein
MMTRPLGLTLAIVVMLCPALTARAQTAADPYRMEESTYGEHLDQLGPYGGFGLEIVQAPRAGGVWMDRFGMLHGAPAVAPARASTAARTAVRPLRSGTSGRIARSQYQLPTGSLYWPGASGVILYSPAMRYQTYGGGYGWGPYGSVDCGIMWKGMSLGY